MAGKQLENEGIFGITSKPHLFNTDRLVTCLQEFDNSLVSYFPKTGYLPMGFGKNHNNLSNYLQPLS